VIHTLIARRVAYRDSRNPRCRPVPTQLRQRWARRAAKSARGFVREFPMTVTGKMQKNLMREAMERELAATPKAAE
jgi:hypothetical protein